MSRTCIAILGPTAVGKTAVAMELAQHYATSIISADSRQCYKELNIGVAKPTPTELETVEHFFINSHSVTEEISAASFEKEALLYAEKVFSKKDTVILTGGTGLYVKAFLEGMDEIPAVNTDLRNRIIEGYKTHGLHWLQELLIKEDPLFAHKGDMRNPQRCMRALEVVRTTGRSILSEHTGTKKQRPFKTLKIGLELPREMLYERINKRVDNMIDDGLIEEARSLYPFRHLNALQTVGYRELFEYFEQRITLTGAVELIKQNTRHYAKRQLTWFKKDAEIKWFRPDSQQILNYLNEAI